MQIGMQKVLTFIAMTVLGITNNQYTEEIQLIKQSDANDAFVADTSSKILWENDWGLGFGSGFITMTHGSKQYLVYCTDPFVPFPLKTVYTQERVDHDEIRAILSAGYPNNSLSFQEKFDKTGAQAYVGTYIALNTVLGSFNEKTVYKGQDAYVNALIEVGKQGLPKTEYRLNHDRQKVVYDAERKIYRSMETYVIEANTQEENEWRMVDSSVPGYLLDTNLNSIQSVSNNQHFFLATDEIKAETLASFTLETETLSTVEKYTSSNVQTLYTIGDEPVQLNLSQYYIPETGTVIINKRDNHGVALSGVTYHIYSQSRELLNSVTTREDGTIELDLQPGVYYVKEVSAPEGLILDESEIAVEVKSNETEVVEVVNAYSRGKLRLYKKDSESLELLPGAVFELVANRDIYEGKTRVVEKGERRLLRESEKGIFNLDDIPFGSYTVKELQPPAGYQNETEETFFIVEINADSAAVIRDVLNTKIPGPPPVEPSILPDSGVIDTTLNTLGLTSCAIGLILLLLRRN